MNERKFQIEYNESKKIERKEFKDKKTGGKKFKQVPVKDPKCWQIVTTIGDTPFRPGTWLTENQLKILRRSKNTIVHVGLPDQFRLINSRY